VPAAPAPDCCSFPRWGRRVIIDILQWLEQLEALLTEGWRIPFTANVVVNKYAYFEIIDQMRTHIPDELRQARKVQQQSERIIAQAREEANRIKGQARQDAETSLSQHEQVVVAQAKAEQILEMASNQAETLRQEADQYALDTLRSIEGIMETSLRTVRNGIKKMSEDAEQAALARPSGEEPA
jgi:cell division septum initiation protein DivIVA